MESNVIVMDFNQAAKEQYLFMREQGDHTPVIFLTEKKFAAEIEALKICCGGHLFHPVKQTELASMVEEMKGRSHEIHCC
jgi:AmiR/NasT family two-component response regulator